MSVELKPCPFCGGDAYTTFTPHVPDGAPTIECGKCFARLSMLVATHAPVVSKWNTRHAPNMPSVSLEPCAIALRERMSRGPNGCLDENKLAAAVLESAKEQGVNFDVTD